MSAPRSTGIESWVQQQVKGGAAMSDCWQPLLVEAWRANNDAARRELGGLTLAQIVRFFQATDPKMIPFSEKGVLARWAATTPATYEVLLAQTGFGAPGSADDPGHTDATSSLEAPKKLSATATALLKRLWSIAQDRGLDPLELLVESVQSANLATLVATNPTKQNPYEPAAAAFLRARCVGQSQVCAVLRLAERGVGIRFRSDGSCFLGERQDRASKSVDLAILVVDPSGQRARWYLCAHKYARSNGGHQDNQREDALAFAEYANRGNDSNDVVRALDALRVIFAPQASDVTWRVGLILDGAYFASSLRSLRAMSTGAAYVGDSDDWANWLVSPGAAC